MIKTKECRVLWSTRFTPEQIKEMMKGACGAADNNDSSDNRYVPGILLYSFNVNRVKGPDWDWFKSPYNLSKPINISYDENGYVFTMKEYDLVADPVIHPIITIDTSDTEDHLPKIRIFGVFERKQLNFDYLYDGVNYPQDIKIGDEILLNFDYLYDGVNYPQDIKIGDEILFADLRKAQMIAMTRLNKPVVKWDELEKDETSSVSSYPFKKREDLDRSFSCLESLLDKLKLSRISRLSWEGDKQSKQYEDLNNDVEKYRDWILKEIDKII